MVDVTKGLTAHAAEGIAWTLDGRIGGQSQRLAAN
jgi:hypothetical protein